MLLTKLRLLSRFQPTVLCRYYRLPQHFLPFLDNFCQEYCNKENSIFGSYKVLKDKIAEYDELENLKKKTSDGELAEMAAADMEDVSEQIHELVEEISHQLVPAEKHDNENAMIEVVPGAGGQEASLFAEEIFYLYLGICERKGFEVELVEVVKNTVNKNTKVVSNSGIVKGVARVLGNEGVSQVFRLLKFESGVHRVQRVPVTGTKADRLQTSTCSVAVLPEPRTIKVNLKESDLKWEFMRAGGAGGQGVNTTDSAVRLTHIPTNTVVESQEERSQLTNKQTALKKLRSVLFQQEWGKAQQKEATSRKLQVGNMNRNEKIRTYNYHRHMVTDHRLGQSTTLPSIQQWFSGSLGYDILDKYREGLEQMDRNDRLELLLASKKI